jgi:hypothetical protein
MNQRWADPDCVAHWMLHSSVTTDRHRRSGPPGPCPRRPGRHRSIRH